ncbi:winged helix-turn-helix transcriptional regulator [Nocardioides ferulae]|uniref:winged helix-turn-helix transcriptional regulator n=1 Tax=Nocardioides ferulae TaxID=2340821 RepID=UPI000EAEEB3B|nr:helix-turn-helix domain-containing protein [Nocardioides ferulae]
MAGYGQFCPVAKTAEILCERWAPLVLRELMCGSSHFSEIQRGVPLMSPTLLSKRLRQLVAAGVVTRTEQGRGSSYALTAAGWELYPIIEAMGVWGQRWARSHYGPDELDPALLMWDIRRMLQPSGLPSRTVVEFRFREAPAGHSRFWLVVDGSEEPPIDLCLIDPGHRVDLWVTCDVRTLTEVWMGDRALRAAVADGSISIEGARALERGFTDWFGAHPVLGRVAPADL